MCVAFTWAKGLAYKALTMALSQRLDLRQTQALVMTPQLQQAIKLLQLSNLELATYLQSEPEQNPLLEADTGDPETRDAATSGEEETDEPTAVSDREAPLDGSSPALDGEDVGLWREAQGQEGEGRIDYAGDPEAWAGRAAGGDRP